MNAHEFTFPAIDGGQIKLGDFRGRPVLVVNTASECGFTPQYHELQALWDARRSQGLVVLAIPSNDFGDQEPGEDAQIAATCRERFGVTFPLTAKQHVLGAQAHPFFRAIEDEFGEAAAPRWNFHKYLVAPDGTLAGAWPSAVTPGDAQIAAALDALNDA